MSKLDQLKNILDTMDVPVMRRTDKEWLLRNLGIRNKNHPSFEKAIEFIKEIL